MPAIRHLAISCQGHDGDKIADFYKHVFGLSEVERFTNSTHPGFTYISLSDGTVNLSLVPGSSGLSGGLHHFGILVDDVDETIEKAMLLGATRSDDAEHQCVQIFDPTGAPIDVAPLDSPEFPIEAEQVRTPSRLQHLAISCRGHDEEKVADFYKEVFSLTEVERFTKPTQPGVSYISVSDGSVNLALLIPDAVGFPPGMHHFGFLVDDLVTTKSRALSLGGSQASDIKPDAGYKLDRIVDPTGARIDIAALDFRGFPVEYQEYSP